MVWSKLKSRIPGGYRKEGEDTLVSKLNVNEEYKEAFRTKSYIEICSKVQVHLERKSMDTISSSSSIPLYVHLSESLLEPRQETLADMIEGHNLHPLLIDYFKITIEASNLCELLLRGIHQTRDNYRLIKRVIKISKITRNGDQCSAMFGDLASFALKRNPFANITQFGFREIRESRNVLLQGLISQRRKILRTVKLRKYLKKVVGCAVVVAYTALIITFLLIAFHAMIGIVAVPALFNCFVGFFKKRKKSSDNNNNKFQDSLKGSNWRERVGEQLDVAAKGVYILINDFNTMSRLVRRLNDEIEHRKAMAAMCVSSGKAEVLKEVVRELRMEESCLLEQLEELEDHIYLCFLTINRSRRLVVQELMHGATTKL